MKHVIIEISSNSTALPNREPRETCWLPCRSFKDARALELKFVQNTEGMKVQPLWPCTPGARPYSEAEQFMYFQHLLSRYDEFVGSSFWFSFDGLWEVTDELDLAGVKILVSESYWQSLPFHGEDWFQSHQTLLGYPPGSKHIIPSQGIF